MKLPPRFAAFALAYATTLSCGSFAALPQLALEPAFPNISLERPVFLAESPDESGRLFLGEQDGRVFILPKNDPGASQPPLFLDIRDRKPYLDNEEGLLGLAFHPEFAANGKFYIHYTQHHPRRNVVSEVHVSSANPSQADLSTERILMEIPQPYGNHNGGALLYGPDKSLYISLGDGGKANDPHQLAQNLGSLLGKILRIDVEPQDGKPYSIPSDNPFLNVQGARPEIFAYGLRNVWKMSFDRVTGELLAGDIGQNRWEEVDLIEKGGNYGWDYREGFHPFEGSPPPEEAILLDPIVEYPHQETQAAESTTPHTPGLSITGGYVYRGAALPELEGVYVYADFALGTIWGLRHNRGKLVEQGVLIEQPKNISSFGEDNDGELYVLPFDGRIMRFVPASAD